MARPKKTAWDLMTDGVCPRCGSKRKVPRLDGARQCMNCGQRWTAQAELIPSFDRRTLRPATETA
ncbi:MAG TPA: hypothetical protein PLL10_00075 [Elusimicrobiales bacterium]|nr:hypothetical protein [Elusimicrobiales bacterium]